MRKDDELKAAVVCQHVALEGMPVLRAIRDEPEEEADSGWQFLCGVHEHGGIAGAQVWALKNVMRDDLVLAILVEEPPGTILARASKYAPWRVV